jgi:hypothetical protein
MRLDFPERADVRTMQAHPGREEATTFVAEETFTALFDIDVLPVRDRLTRIWP